MAEVVHKEIKGKVTIEADEAKKRLEEVRKSLIKTTEASISGFNSAANAARGLSSVLTQVSIMSFVFNLTQRRLSHTQETVTVATERLERQLRKYGRGSEQAEAASRKLKLAQEDLGRAQFESNLQIALFGMQAPIVAIRVVDAARKLSEFEMVTKASAAASMLAGKAQAFYTAMTEAAMLITIKNKVVQAAATIVDWGRAAALWAQAHAVNVITLGMAALAAATGYYIYQATVATEQSKKLEETVGKGPGSTGLVKSFHDVTAALGEFKFSVGGISISPILERKFDAEWRNLGSRIKSDLRRIS